MPAIVRVMRSGVLVRGFLPADETAWLHCRVLAFLATDYYDDVKPTKTVLEPGGIELVAIAGEELVGLMDLRVDGSEATIDTVAVHPDSARTGVASQLLATARDLLPPEVTSVDAWTREDQAANDWYLRRGFVERFRYLHLYTSAGTIDGYPVAHALLHAPIEQEAAIRAAYDRVYVCRQYVLSL
jgi:ribosomal protein S18 acetylase RimI-like enzyme